MLPRSPKLVRDKRKSMKRVRRDIKLRGNTECFDNFALRIQMIGVHDFLRGTQQYTANQPKRASEVDDTMLPMTIQSHYCREEQ